MRIGSVTANALLATAGGVFSQLFFSAAPDGDLPGVIAVIVCLLFCIVFVVELVSIFKISDSTPHSMFAALFILLTLLFSPDMQAFFASVGATLDPLACDVVGNLCFIGAALSFACFFRYAYPVGERKIDVRPLFLAAAVCAVGCGALAVAHLQSIAYFLFAAALGVWFVVLQVRVFRAGADDATFVFSAAILFSSIGMRTVDTLRYAGIAYGAGWDAAYAGGG